MLSASGETDLSSDRAMTPPASSRAATDQTDPGTITGPRIPGGLSTGRPPRYTEVVSPSQPQIGRPDGPTTASR